MFPGQSSAYPEMVARARALAEETSEVAECAESVLGPDRAARYLGDSVPLECNRDVQIGVFLATQMHLAALAGAGIKADMSVGMSLGEYSHLVHIGALPLDEALRLIDERGAAYDRAPHGVMVSVTGPQQSEVEDIVDNAGGDGTVVVSNYNSPTQHVVAGEKAAVDRVVARLEDEGAHAVLIESRVAMHSPLLDDTAIEFRRQLEDAEWHTPAVPYLPNVTAEELIEPSRDEFVHQLTAHVHRPVLWRRSIEHLADRFPDSRFVEVGPGRVLHNLMSRRWLDVPRYSTDARSDEQPRTLWRDTWRLA